MSRFVGPDTLGPGAARSGRQLGGLLIMTAYLLAGVLAAVTLTYVAHEHSQIPSPVGEVSVNAPRPAVPKYLVLMVLDGATPDYLSVGSLPHVDALRSQGTQFTNAIDGILEAETPAGHATIATGSRPDHNGILGFDWANVNDRTSLFSPDKMGTLETILQDAHAPTLAGLYKKQYPQAKVVALSGHKYYAAAPLGGPSADAIMYYNGDPTGKYVPQAVPGHVPPASVLSAPGVVAPKIKLPDGGEDHLATTLALSAVGIMHPRMLLINYPEFDWPLGHVDGGMKSPAKVTTDMQGFDTDLGRIEDAYRRAGILNQTLFVITADHGMMPISHFVPASTITTAITKAGTTAPDIAGSTGDYIWLADITKAPVVARNILAANDPGIESAYYLSTSGGRPHYVSADPSSVSVQTDAANQYLLESLLNGHQPSVVVFAKEGVTFSDPASGWKADHGGNSWASQHMPLILAGPGIQSGLISDSPVQLEDIAPTVLEAMGVQPTGMQGTPLAEALTNPSDTAQKARGDEITWLDPVVQALTAQSKVDTSG